MEEILKKIIKDAVDDAIKPLYLLLKEKKDKDDDERLDTKEALAFLKTKSPNTLQSRCIEYEIHPTKIGNKNVYWKSDLMKIGTQSNQIIKVKRKTSVD